MIALVPGSRFWHCLISGEILQTGPAPIAETLFATPLATALWHEISRDEFLALKAGWPYWRA